MCRLPLLCLLFIVVTAVASPWAGADPCKPARYQIMGKVRDVNDRPVADATVRLLLDRISAPKFSAEGPRARLTRTNGFGTYVALIDCEAARGTTDAPNPCADKPRHLTVGVEARGLRMKLVVFRLKELDITKDAGGCLVEVPAIKLSSP